MKIYKEGQLYFAESPKAEAKHYLDAAKRCGTRGQKYAYRVMEKQGRRWVPKMIFDDNVRGYRVPVITRATKMTTEIDKRAERS